MVAGTWLRGLADLGSSLNFSIYKVAVTIIPPLPPALCCCEIRYYGDTSSATAHRNDANCS